MYVYVFNFIFVTSFTYNIDDPVSLILVRGTQKRHLKNFQIIFYW